MREGNELVANVVQTANSYVQIGAGPTSARPSTASAGMMRWNTTLTGWDTYDGTNWDTHAWASIEGSDNITSESMHFVYDTTRSKYLSGQHMQINYQAATVKTNDYIYPSATAFASDVATKMMYDGTIVGFTAYLSNPNKCVRSVTMYTGSTGATSHLSVFIFGSTTATTAVNASISNVNIDFAAGDLLKCQMAFSSGTTANAWTNLNMVMHYKWRM